MLVWGIHKLIWLNILNVLLVSSEEIIHDISLTYLKQADFDEIHYQALCRFGEEYNRSKHFLLMQFVMTLLEYSLDRMQLLSTRMKLSFGIIVDTAK